MKVYGGESRRGASSTLAESSTLAMSHQSSPLCFATEEFDQQSENDFNIFREFDRDLFK
jgi:hypothetical protein